MDTKQATTDREQVRAAIAQYLQDYPNESYAEVAKSLGCAESTIAGIAAKYKITRRHIFTSADVAALRAAKEGK